MKIKNKVRIKKIYLNRDETSCTSLKKVLSYFENVRHCFTKFDLKLLKFSEKFGAYIKRKI